MENLRHRIEYILLRIVAEIFCILPEKVALSLASSIGAFFFYCIPIRKKIVINNIAQAFPDKDNTFYQNIALAAYKNLVISFAEFSRLRKMSEEDIRKKVLNFNEVKEKLTQYANRNALIAITGHIGNWELMAAASTLANHPISVIAKPIHNPYVNKYINAIRTQKGYEIIETGSLAKRIITKLKEGNIVGFLADQDARKNGIFVNFFGKPASTYKGPALFSIKQNIPIFPLFCIRDKNNKYKIIFKEVLYPSTNETDSEKAIEALTQKHISVLEEIIKEYPEQYFWFHRRWKTRKQ